MPPAFETRPVRRLLLVFVALVGGIEAGCGSDAGAAEEAPAGGEQEPLYALATLTSSGDESLTYVPLLDDLEPQEIDFDEAREFSGLADIVWNPQSMQIEGTMAMPPLEERDGLQPFASYVDRSVAIVDGLMYHPYYFTDDDYFAYSETSAIAVYDVEDNALVRVIDAPCPGLDHVSIDEDENLYFSSWVYAPGGAAVLAQPSTCVAKLEKGASEATVAFYVKDVTDGLEGGVFRYVGDGKAFLSVLDRDHAAPDEQDDPSAVAFGANWRFWSYDMESGEAEIVEAIDWNSGTAAYVAGSAGRSYALIGDYMTTVVYDITTPSEPRSLCDVEGWAVRLVQVR